MFIFSLIKSWEMLYPLQMNGEINRCAHLMVDCMEEATNQDATVEMKKSVSHEWFTEFTE